MPEEYIGKTYTDKDGRVLRRWTKEEEEWCIELKKQGCTQQAIADSVGRDVTQTAIKLKRLLKRINTYNSKHVEDKYEVNRKFIEYINPESVLDVYCGVNSFYRSEYPNLSIVTNDIDEKIKADYHMDSYALLNSIKDSEFDLVDLDPFGSAYECFDLAIQMAKKGLVITLGELGHQRWKRLDFVSKHYGIDKLEDFTIDNLVNEIIKIGKQNNKILKPYQIKSWHHIGRVWFEILEEQQ
jgi:hypothetical protein